MSDMHKDSIIVAIILALGVILVAKVHQRVSMYDSFESHQSYIDTSVEDLLELKRDWICARGESERSEIISTLRERFDDFPVIEIPDEALRRWVTDILDAPPQD